jgi:tetratricopeptide (TPR) repeat protein
MAAPEKRAGVAITEEDRALGLALFEAEEALARGQADKALVAASRVVKEHPESLTARALVDRARRELLRGRRRERLETRVRQAESHIEAGDLEAAGRIVTSALKLIPDHPLALSLFARLKDRRLKAGTAEADAERELLALARAQAQQCLETARTALAAGRGRQALLALRRGLGLVPDDPDLQALLKDAQRSLEGLESERSRRHALASQVRAGLELLAQGRVDESLKMLRAVLRENPENQRAQAAIQEVRRRHLRLLGPSQAAPMALPIAPAPPRPGPSAPPTPPSGARAQPPTPVHTPRPEAPRGPAPRSPSRPTALPSRVVPPEIMLPRTRRRGTPVAFVLAGGGLLLAFILVIGRSASPPPRPREAEATATPVPGTAATPQAPSGPLAMIDADLRQAIESTLRAYAQALEKGDLSLLAAARPDMTAGWREKRLAPFIGALNATTDIRVLDVALRGDEATVSVLCTDVIVGGRREAGPPSDELLRFVRRGGSWTLGGVGGDAGRSR